MMKRNPGISEETLLRRIRRFSVRKSFLMLFSVFLFLGIFVAYSYSQQESMKLSLALFLFFSSIFMTSVSLQQTTASGVFEPLRAMPIVDVEKKISILFLIDSLSILGIAVPSVILLALQSLFDAVIFLFWLIFAILFGHTVGMAFLALFGARIAMRSKIFSKIFMAGFVLFLTLLMIPGFVSSGIFGEAPEISRKYYYIYPFTVLCKPEIGFFVLLAYTALLFPIYRFLSKKGVNALFDPKFERQLQTSFRVFRGGKTLTLVLKDLKLVYRHPSGLVGIILPFLLTAPQIIVAGSLGGKESLLIQIVSVFSLFSPIILGLITRGEGREIDFLRALPVSKKEFVLAKVFTTSLIICSGSVALTMIGYFFEISPMAFLIAISLPMTVSFLSALYLFNYPGDEVGIPEMGIRRMATLFILCTFLVAILMTPIEIFADLRGYGLTFFLSLILLAIIFRKMRN
ncbi:MAG: hypothetical protein QXQ38_01130 [Archaeoglobaceae archaeon]